MAVPTTQDLLDYVNTRIAALLSGTDGGDIAEYIEASERVRYKTMTLTELMAQRTLLQNELAATSGSNFSLGVPTRI